MYINISAQVSMRNLQPITQQVLALPNIIVFQSVLGSKFRHNLDTLYKLFLNDTFHYYIIILLLFYYSLSKIGHLNQTIRQITSLLPFRRIKHIYRLQNYMTEAYNTRDKTGFQGLR